MSHPKPDWGREGESWRIEPAPYWWVLPFDSVQECDHRPRGKLHCFRRAIAYVTRDPRSMPRTYWCSLHMDARWIQQRQVVEWVLRPDAQKAENESRPSGASVLRSTCQVTTSVAHVVAPVLSPESEQR